MRYGKNGGGGGGTMYDLKCGIGIVSEASDLLHTILYLDDQSATEVPSAPLATKSPASDASLV